MTHYPTHAPSAAAHNDAHRIGNDCIFVWLAFFASFIFNLCQVTYTTTLKRQLRNLTRYHESIAIVDSEILPEATIVTEEPA